MKKINENHKNYKAVTANFQAALNKLIEFSQAFDGSEIHQAGLIQAFEFTFEQC